MSEYKKQTTSAEVFAVIMERHPEMTVFSTYSAPEGDYFGNPEICRMVTEYGFKDGCVPLIGIETTWDRQAGNNYKRINEKHNYWICIPTDD